jgi:dihydroorotate dehydrogenase
MYRFLKVFLFRIDPERAHHITMWWLMLVLRIPGVKFLFKALFQLHHPSLERTVAGMKFSNPVGLAAGFDKNGLYLNAMAALGFSHIEVGTITPGAQDGNPKPRLFRLIQSRALINRMGFNNDGVEVLAKRLEKKRPNGLVVGANIGKNKITPNEEAANDYLICFQRLYHLVDYFTVNVSSPNTPGLRELQDKKPLTELLTALQTKNRDSKPVFLKIAPDLTTEQLDEIVDIIIETKLTGVIATNTTITRSGLSESRETIESIGAGGLSGAPLIDMSVSVVRYLKEKSKNNFVVIGVGGIEDYTTAKKHLDVGADLIQVYSGLIYTGPGLVKGILKRLYSSDVRRQT